MKKTKSFDENCINEYSKIIIYGASVYGELAYKGLVKMCGVHPDYFCDRASAGNTKYDIEIIHPDDLEDYRDAIILIASADYFWEIKEFLDDMGCTNYYDLELILKQEFDRNEISHRAVEMLDNLDIYIKTINNAPDSNKVHIVHMGFTVTEACTLKCKDCSFLMQYYQHPKNIDIEKYRYCFDRFLDIVDYITEIRPIGGEPFVNPDMYKVLEWYYKNPKIGSLDVYTNGTIVPNDVTLNALKLPKVKVHISDYGVVNKERLEKVLDVFEKEKISYSLRKYETWQVGGNLACRNFTEQQKKEVFNKCFMTNCYSFIKDRFYGCPRAAHGINMGAIPDFKSDYIDFADESVSDAELKRQLISLTKQRNYLESCNYCDGFDNHIDGVEPAVQVKIPLTIR